MAYQIPTLTNKEFKNWVKGALALDLTKVGLTDFVSAEVDRHHQRLLQLVPATSIRNRCNCTIKSLLPCTRSRSHSHIVPGPGELCSRGVCNILMDAICKDHRFRIPSWRNTDPQKWCTDAFAVAKCFLPPDGYSNKTSLLETDFNGIVSVISNNLSFSTKVQENLATQSNICTKLKTDDIFIDENDITDPLKTHSVAETDQIVAVIKTELEEYAYTIMKDITKTDYNLPEEILKMDATDIKLYKKALAEGEEKVYNIRVMIVGHFGVGKTVLTKRLLDQHQDVDILSRIPTEGIDVHVGKMKVDLKDENWIQQTSDDGNKFFERKAKVVSQQITEGDKISDFSKKISAAGVKTMSKQQIEYQKTTEEDDEEDFEEDGDESLQESFESGGVKEMETNKQTNVSIENQNEDSSTETDMKICQEISEVRKVTQNEQSAYLSIWDCAGQYAFYDTHQSLPNSG